MMTVLYIAIGGIILLVIQWALSHLRKPMPTRIPQYYTPREQPSMVGSINGYYATHGKDAWAGDRDVAKHYHE